MLSVDSSTSLEILRCTQDDILYVRFPRSLCSLGMTVEELLLALVGGRLFAIGGEFLELAHAVTVLRGGYKVE